MPFTPRLYHYPTSRNNNNNDNYNTIDNNYNDNNDNKNNNSNNNNSNSNNNNWGCLQSDKITFLGPQGPLIEPSIPSTRPPTTIFLFLLLLLILLSPPPSPWGGLLLLLLLQMIIRRDHPLANDHPDQPDSSPFFFLFFSEFIIFLRQTFCLLLQILGSRLNLFLEKSVLV